LKRGDILEKAVNSKNGEFDKDKKDLYAKVIINPTNENK
jgi:hypothetical protein